MFFLSSLSPLLYSSHIPLLFTFLVIPFYRSPSKPLQGLRTTWWHKHGVVERDAIYACHWMIIVSHISGMLGDDRHRFNSSLQGPTPLSLGFLTHLIKGIIIHLNGMMMRTKCKKCKLSTCEFSPFLSSHNIWHNREWPATHTTKLI